MNKKTAQNEQEVQQQEFENIVEVLIELEQGIRNVIETAHNNGDTEINTDVFDRWLEAYDNLNTHMSVAAAFEELGERVAEPYRILMRKQTPYISIDERPLDSDEYVTLERFLNFQAASLRSEAVESIEIEEE